MIDPELRDIITPELAAGEELLWAEKISHEARMAWAQSKLKSDQNTFKILIGVSVFMTAMVFAFESWRTDSRILVLIPFAILVSLGFVGSVFNPEKKKLRFLQQREVGAYALSNFQLFTLDLSLAVSERQDAREVKWAKPFKQMPKWKWVTTNLSLSPIGSGWIRIAELYFLNDFKATEAYINSQIQRIKS